MPRRGYTSTGKNSLPDEIVKSIDELKEDPEFIREMRMRGITRITRALILRVAVIELLKKYGKLETSG